MNTEPIPSPSPNPKPDPNRQVVIGVAVILGICLVCCVTVGIGAVLAAPVLQEWASSQAGTPLKVDTPAPDFELADLHGETVRLSQFQGQPVLLVFGATWCPPCRAEAPLIQELHENHPEMTVLLVDMKESASTVQQYVNQMGLTHRVLLDEKGKVSSMYHIFAIPSSFFIDAEGILQAMLVEQLTPSYLRRTLPLIGVTP